MSLAQLRKFLSNRVNLLTLYVMGFPTLGAIYVIFSGILWQIHPFTFKLFLIFYCTNIIGITVGYHRYLTHRSFKTSDLLGGLLVAFGCMAFEGPPSFWVGSHRRHHMSPDKQLDPHSPFKNNKLSFKTFWHAHLGWMYNHKISSWSPYVSREFRESKLVRFFDHHYWRIASLGLILPAVINGIVFRSWYHLWEGFMVCGLFRIFLQHHMTWSINSIGHIWGAQDFKTEDHSKNNLILGILAFGEGWHNGHHAFPGSARHGLLWWQLDLSYLLIKFFALCGLAKDIKVPNESAIMEKMIERSGSKSQQNDS